jgi:hypothetical protein
MQMTYPNKSKILQSLVFAFALLLAKQALALKIVTVTVPNAADVKIILPQGWEQEDVKYSTGLAPTVRFLADSARTIAVQLTFFQDKNMELSTQEKIDEKLKTIAEHEYLPHAVEKKVTILHLKSKNLIGSYAKFTDSHLAKEKNVAPPKYKFITTGTLALGDTTGAVTILSNSLDDKEYKKAISLLTDSVLKK